MRRHDAAAHFRIALAIAAASLLVATGCGRPNVELKRQGLIPASVGLALANADAQLPRITGTERPLSRAGAPAEPLEIGPGGKLILVHCVAEEVPAAIKEEWHRAHLIVLDSLSTGTFEVTPDNGRMIETTPWRPARRPYVGLEGSIEIVSISDHAVVANCKLRNVIKRSGDPVYALRGLYRFTFATGEELALSRCAIKVTGLGAAPAPAAP